MLHGDSLARIIAVGRSTPVPPTVDNEMPHDAASGNASGFASGFASIVEQARRDRMAGRRREALGGYTRAADLARLADDRAQLAHAQRHVSDLHRELGEHRLAESAAAEAVSLLGAPAGDASLDLANALRVLALAQESLDEWPAAQASWRAARSLYDELGVLPGVQECDEHLGRR